MSRDLAASQSNELSFDISQPNLPSEAARFVLQTSSMQRLQGDQHICCHYMNLYMIAAMATNGDHLIQIHVKN